MWLRFPPRLSSAKYSPGCTSGTSQLRQKSYITYIFEVAYAGGTSFPMRCVLYHSLSILGMDSIAMHCIPNMSWRPCALPQSSSIAPSEIACYAWYSIQYSVPKAVHLSCACLRATPHGSLHGVPRAHVGT